MWNRQCTMQKFGFLQSMSRRDTKGTPSFNHEKLPEPIFFDQGVPLGFTSRGVTFGFCGVTFWWWCGMQWGDL